MPSKIQPKKCRFLLCHFQFRLRSRLISASLLGADLSFSLVSPPLEERLFSVAYVNIPSVIKNYTSKGASRYFIYIAGETGTNIVLLNDVFLIKQWRLILYLNFKT